MIKYFAMNKNMLLVILVISVKAKGRRKITYELRTCLYMGGGQTQKYFFYTLKMHSTLKH